MNLFTSLLRTITGSEKAAPSNYPGTWVSVSNGAGGINQSNLLEANQEWVYLAVDKIGKSVAAIRFKVMRYARTGDDQEVFNGPLVDFLDNPAPNFTGKDFIYLDVIYKELTGNAFWENTGGMRLAPLIPTRVTPIVSDGELIGIKYNDGKAQRDIVIDDLLHDRSMDPARPYWGVGKLQKVARWADTSSNLTEFLSRFFVNGATFGGFIETDEESEARLKLIKLGLKQDHTGVANAHKLGVLPRGSKFAPNSTSMVDLEMGATDDRYRDKILAAFGVPKTLVGLTTDVNRASAEASEYIYAKYTIKPLADDLIEFLNTNVAAKLDPSCKFYFAYDDFIPEDTQSQVEMRKNALASQPYMTVNEVRATVGLPPVENGDQVLSNPTMQPLGTPAPAPAPAPTEDPSADPAADPKDDQTEPKKLMPSRARAGFGRERMIDDILERATEFATAHHDPDEESHKKFVSRVGDHLDLVAGKVRDFNNRQERDVTQRLKQIAKGVQKGDLFDMDGEVSVLIDFVGPILKSLMLEQAVQEYLDQGYAGHLDPKQPRINSIIALAAKRLAKSYNATTATLITSTLNDGIKNGEDLTQLTSRVKAVYEYSNTVRAKMVAHTEAFYIANEGSREAYRQSGVVQTMRWYTAEDEKVCDFCGPEDGRIVDVDDVFYEKGTTITAASGATLDLSYRTIDVPPLHPQCRCFIRPEEITIS